MLSEKRVTEVIEINMCGGSSRECKYKISVKLTGVLLEFCGLQFPDCPKTGNHSSVNARLMTYES